MKAEDTYVGQVVRASGRYGKGSTPGPRGRIVHYPQTGVEAASKSLPDEMVRSRCEREVVAESVASSEQFGGSPWLDISQSRADLLTVLFREGVVFDMGSSSKLGLDSACTHTVAVMHRLARRPGPAKLSVCELVPVRNCCAERHDSWCRMGSRARVLTPIPEGTSDP